MRKRYSGILVVVAAATQLTGCSMLHISGPCFGVGCPARTPGEYSQYNPGSNGPKAAAFYSLLTTIYSLFYPLLFPPNVHVRTGPTSTCTNWLTG